MDTKKSQCLKCDGDVIVDTGHCPKCSASLKFFKTLNPHGSQAKRDPSRTSVKSMETSYVTQIVSSGVRDNIYETKLLLAPEVDLSSIKITVKGNNLRVNVCKPLDDQYARQLPEISEKSIFADLIKGMMKHCENLLIPEGIDNAKVRAVVDNKHRMLVLTAPAVKPSKTRKYMEKS